MKKTTEASSKFNHLEKMNTLNILQGINQEDKTVAQCVELVIPQIQKFIEFLFTISLKLPDLSNNSSYFPNAVTSPFANS